MYGFRISGSLNLGFRGCAWLQKPLLLFCIGALWCLVASLPDV